MKYGDESRGTLELKIAGLPMPAAILQSRHRWADNIKMDIGEVG
jgi:hypothetical protein